MLDSPYFRVFLDGKINDRKDCAPAILGESCYSLGGQSLQWPGETPLSPGRP